MNTSETKARLRCLTETSLSFFITFSSVPTAIHSVTPNYRAYKKKRLFIPLTVKIQLYNFASKSTKTLMTHPTLIVSKNTPKLNFHCKLTGVILITSSFFFHLRAHSQCVNYSGTYNWGCSLLYWSGHTHAHAHTPDCLTRSMQVCFTCVQANSTTVLQFCPKC